MSSRDESIVSSVGDTVQEVASRAGGWRPSRYQHYVLNYHEIITGRFREVPVGAGVLAVLSTFPVMVIADGEPIVTDEDLQPIDTTGPLGNNFQPGFWGGAPIAVIRPGLAFTLRRKIAKLSILTSAPTADYAAGNVPGTCHLWIGPDDMEDMGFGLPISHTLTDTAAGALGTIETLEWTGPWLHDGGLSNVSGLVWLPSRTEINGMVVEVTWTGVAGVISQVEIGMRQIAPNFFLLARYVPNTVPWDYDFGTPIEIPSFQTIAFAADARSRLVVRVTATQDMATLTATLRCKSWM